jgi:hypothetical protein
VELLLNKRIRNLTIFAIIAVVTGFIGFGLSRLSSPEDSMKALGSLLWLVAPLAANLVLRAFGGDGWTDFGLLPHFKESLKWYLVGLVIPVIVTLIISGLGAAAGVISFAGFTRMGFSAFLPLFISGFTGVMIKNIFEEYAWRGYLTPRLEALGVHPFVNSILTGFIWAAWHIPYYLYYLDRSVLAAHSSLALPVFIALTFLVLPLQSLAYGELRLISKSVLPVWLMHNVANAISLPLFEEGFVSLGSGAAGVLLSPGTDGILYSLFMGSIGLWLYFYRRRQSSV